MPLERKRDIARAHAMSIVGDDDPFDPAPRQCDIDPRRSGIDRVLDQLFEHGGGALDDLARRNPVDEMFGQAAY